MLSWAIAERNIALDERRFDDMARSLAQNVSRRGALKGFAAAVGGGVLSAMGLRSAEAKVRRAIARSNASRSVVGTILAAMAPARRAKHVVLRSVNATAAIPAVV